MAVVSAQRFGQSACDPAICARARTGLGMCRKNAHTKEEIAHSKAKPYRPPAKLSVRSFTTPTYQGPKNPPRLPIELIQAIEAAAAVPVRNIGGIAQNGPFEP